MTDDSLPNTDAARAREGMVDELKTINKYEEMADAAQNPDVADTLREVADDERVHVGNFGALVAAEDPKAVPKMMEGVEETVKDTGIKLRVLKRSATDEFKKAKPLMETPRFEEVGGSGVMVKPQAVIDPTVTNSSLLDDKNDELTKIRKDIQDLLDQEGLFKKKNPAELEAFARKLASTDDYLNHDLNEAIFHLQADDLETLESIYSDLVNKNSSINPDTARWFIASIREAKGQNSDITKKINDKMAREEALRKEIAKLKIKVESEKKEAAGETEDREVLSGFGKPEPRLKREPKKTSQEVIAEKMDAVDRARFGGVDPVTGKQMKGAVEKIRDLLDAKGGKWLIEQLDEVRSPKGNYTLFLKKDSDIREAIRAMRETPAQYEWKWKKNADPELVKLVELDKSLAEKSRELYAKFGDEVKTLAEARREQKKQQFEEDYENASDEEEKQEIKEKQLQEQKDAQLLKELRSRQVDQDTDEFDEGNWYDTSLVGDTYYTTSGQAINPFGYHYDDDAISSFVSGMKKKDGQPYKKTPREWLQGIRDSFGNFEPLTDENAYSTYTFPKSTLLYRTAGRDIIGALARMGITTVGQLRKFVSDPNGWPAIYKKASEAQQTKIRNSNRPAEEQEKIKNEIMARDDLSDDDKAKIIDTMFLNEEDQRDIAAKMPHLITGRLGHRIAAVHPWEGKERSDEDREYIRNNFGGFGSPGGTGMSELSKYLFGRKAGADGKATEDFVFPDEMPLREYDKEQPQGEDSVEARDAYGEWIRNNYLKSSYSAVERAKTIMALIGTAVQTVRDPNATPEAKEQAINRAKTAVDAYEKGQKLSPQGNPLMNDYGAVRDSDLSRDPIGKQLISYIRNKPILERGRMRIPQDQIDKMRAEDAQKAIASNTNYDQESGLELLKDRFADIAEGNLLRGIYSQGMDIQNDIVKQNAQRFIDEYVPKVSRILSASNVDELPSYVKEALTDVQGKLADITSGFNMQVKGTKEYEATRGKRDKEYPDASFLFGDRFQKYAIPMIDRVAQYVSETPEGEVVFDREGYYTADMPSGSFDILAKKILNSDSWKKDVGVMLQRAASKDAALAKKYSPDNPEKPSMSELLMDLTRYEPTKIMRWVGGADKAFPRRNYGDTAAELYLLRQDNNEASVNPESVKWGEPRKDRIGSHISGVQLDREFMGLRGKEHKSSDKAYDIKEKETGYEDDKNDPPSWDDEFWDFEEERYLAPDEWYAKYGDDSTDDYETTDEEDESTESEESEEFTESVPEAEDSFKRSATNKRPPLRVERVFSQAIPFYGVKLDLNDNEPFDAAKYKTVKKEVQGSKRTNIDSLIAGRQKQ